MCRPGGGRSVVKGEPPGPSNFWINLNIAFSTNKQSRFADQVVIDCLLIGHPAPSAEPLMVSLILFSSRSNAQGVLKDLEGRLVSTKSPTRVRVGDQGVAGRNEREKYLTDVPSKQINDFIIVPI